MAQNYPLKMSFKVLALAPQIYISDAGGNALFYVRQKLLKLKEEINVFRDDSQSETLYKIAADRIIDFSARYNFSDPGGNPLGSVKRKGGRSLWRANYHLFSAGSEMEDMEITEESVMVRFLDACLQSVPIVGMFAGYFFNPTYLVTRKDGTPVMRLSKQPAFFESAFVIDKLADLDDATENRILLSLMMMILLERARG
jgi:hypothetical protein